MSGIAWGGVLGLVLVILAIAIVVQVLFLMNLRDLLRNVSPQNRTMDPNYVWLNFIPLFGTVWMFVTVIRVRDSVRAEYALRGLPVTGDFGYGVGMTYAIVSVISGGSSLSRVNSTSAAAVGGVVGVVGLVGLVCWIVYWVRTNELKQRLMQPWAPASSAAAPPQAGQWGTDTYGQYLGYGVAAKPSAPLRSCGSCGAQIPAEDVFCRLCGTRMDAALSAGAEAPTQVVPPTESTCPFCGAGYRDGAQFCSVCGRPRV